MNLVTVYSGGGANGDPFLMGLYHRLLEQPPAGWTVLLHTTSTELCDGITSSARSLSALEVVAHGNPYFLGAITLDQIPAVQGALRELDSSCKVYLSGCNTGTFAPDGQGGEATSNITTMLGSGLACQILGSLGYLNQYTVADGMVACSANDWGQEADCVYYGSTDAVGLSAFKAETAATDRVKSQAAKLARPSSAAPRSLDSLLVPLIDTPSQNVHVNPRTGPDFTATYQGRRFQILSQGRVLREPATGKTWRIAPRVGTHAVVRVPDAVSDATRTP